MKNKFRPIAMKCNQEQFDTVKGKLEKSGLKIKTYEGFEYFCYLCNPTVSNPIIGNYKIIDKDREIYETWNEKLFLESCGIEVEESFIITKEQILHVEKTSPYSVSKELKQWFPKAFEEEKKELVVGKWYISDGYLINKQEGANCFGFYLYRNSWIKNVSHELSEHISGKYREATEQEVFDALKKEAVKRYKIGDYVKCLKNREHIENLESSPITHDNHHFYQDNDFWIGIVLDRSACVFWNGKWAEIIPTISLKEAEERLNCKIV